MDNAEALELRRRATAVEDRVIWLGVLAPASVVALLLNIVAQAPDQDFTFKSLSPYLMALGWAQMTGASALAFSEFLHLDKAAGRHVPILTWAIRLLPVASMGIVLIAMALMTTAAGAGTLHLGHPAQAAPAIATQPAPPAR